MSHRLDLDPNLGSHLVGENESKWADEQETTQLLEIVVFLYAKSL